jgi:hypothetical protein
MHRALLFLCGVLPISLFAQSSQPTSQTSTKPSSQPTTQSSQPTSQANTLPTSEPSIEDTYEILPVLKRLPPASLVLRGLPEPVKNLRVGLHADHFLFRSLPGDNTTLDATSFDTVVMLISKRLYTGLLLETRIPVTHQARNDFEPDGTLLSSTQTGAFGNLSLALNQSLGGKLRKALSLEVSLPTASSSAEGIQTGALTAVASRYELPLFLPGAFALRGRVAAGTVFNKIGAVAELGLDALWPVGDASALPTPFQLDVRGGLSLSYKASEIFSALGEFTFATTLTDGEDNDDLTGDLNSVISLHLGGRVFLGRVSIGGFVTIPQDEPLSTIANLGIGIDVFSALF